MPGSSTTKAKAKASHKDRQSRSRNTTPLSSTSVSVHVDVKSDAARHTVERSTSPYISTSLGHPPRLTQRWSDTPLADLFDEHVASTNTSTIPSARALNAIWEKIESHIWPTFKDREDKSHELMSEVAGKQKERIERDHQRGLERARRDAEEKRQQQKKKNNSSTPKKADREEVRPPTVGSHGVARQDGKDSMREHSSPMSSIDSRPPSNPDTTMEDVGEKGSDSEAEEQRQPPPAATIPQFQIFGDDPSQFPDDTIYEVLEITNDMTDEEKKAIYSVARFPATDLRDKIAGIPPDKDFSNAKPTSQVAAQTFANFVEPYLRPLTQEDLGFLQERQDRVHVFEIPKRGRHYKEVWAEEDGTNFLDQDALKLSTNEPRGSIDQMNDDVAESDEVSAGPITARWLALSRPITRPSQDDCMTNGTGTEMEIDGDTNDDQKNESQTPATAFPESTWKNLPHAATSDFGSQESRLLEELRHIGFLSATDVPSFAEQQDDEVSARLRYLQRELHRVSLINGARKARIAEIADGRMAAQEWQGISDDLDEQLKQAYLKRNRNIGKGKKQIKRPGTAAPVGLARNAGSAVGEPIRSLVERRAQWNDLIGPVVDHGQVSVPKETIFDKENMDRLIKLEQDNWIDTSEEA